MRFGYPLFKEFGAAYFLFFFVSIPPLSFVVRNLLPVGEFILPFLSSSSAWPFNSSLIRFSSSSSSECDPSSAVHFLPSWQGECVLPPPYESGIALLPISVDLSSSSLLRRSSSSFGIFFFLSNTFSSSSFLRWRSRASRQRCDSNSLVDRQLHAQCLLLLLLLLFFQLHCYFREGIRAWL